MIREIRDVLYLVDLDGTPLRSIQKRWDLSVEHIDDVSSVLKVSIDITEPLIIEQQFIFRGIRYIITKIEQDKRDQRQTVEAEAAFIELNDRLKTVDISGETLRDFIITVLEDTGWTVGTVQDDRTHSYQTEQQSALSILRLMAQITDRKLVFDTINRTVSYLEPSTQDAGFLFRYRKNLQTITKLIQAPKATVLIPYGANDIDVKPVNDGVEYVEDFSWYISLGYTLEEARALYSKTFVWKDERFIYPGTLKQEAEKKLATLSHPQITYGVQVAQVAVDVRPGSYGYVVDEELGIKVNVKVVRIIEAERQEDTTVELNYLLPGLSDVQNNASGSGDGGSRITTATTTNLRRYEAGDTFSQLLRLSVTNVGATILSGGFNVRGQVETNSVLIELIVDVDGVRTPYGIKETANQGFRTFSTPFVIELPEAGSHVIRVMGTTSNGEFVVEMEDANMFVQGQNMEGGSAGPIIPVIDIIEDVTVPQDSPNVSETANLALQIPLAIDKTELVELPSNVPEVTETVDITTT